jgi:hypothetical protein
MAGFDMRDPRGLGDGAAGAIVASTSSGVQPGAGALLMGCGPACGCAGLAGLGGVAGRAGSGMARWVGWLLIPAA